MKEKKIKFDIKQKKDNTIKSLQQVENFLHNIGKINKGRKIYNILKRK